MPSRRVLVVFALAAAMATACSDAPRAGLQVKGYAADIVFGVPKEEPIASPAAVTPPVVTQEQASADLEPLTVLAPEESEEPAPRPTTTVPSRPACPDAVPGSAASEAAPLNVPAGRRPVAGRYRWKKAGSQSLPAAIGGGQIAISGFESRTIRNVRETGDGQFSFQTVQPALDLQSLTVTTWQVKTAPVRERAGTLDQAVVVGELERGLVIKSIETVDASGSPKRDVTPFRPTSGLLVLPLPVEAGETFSSAAVDPTTLATAVFEAQVLRRDRVDACGQFVEGWVVQGTLTFSEEAGPIDYTVVVSPQLGGIPVGERYAGQSGSGLTYDLSFAIGQLQPDPGSAG